MPRARSIRRSWSRRKGRLRRSSALLEVFTGQRLALEPLHRSRQPLLPHPEGRRSGRQGAVDAGGPGARAARDRAHPGLFAGGTRAQRAHVRHAAGPACRRSSSLPASPTSRRPTGISARSIFRCTTRGSPSAADPEKRVRGGARSRALRDILCIEDERVVARDNTVAYEGRCLQLPQSPAARPLRQGARARCTSTRTAHSRSSTARVGLRATRPRVEIVEVPTCAQRGAVLAAVKAWPANAELAARRAATASLDGVCARRPAQLAGRDEETVLQVEQRN